MKSVPVIVAVLLGASGHVAAQPELNRGRLMWSAFQCATYAEMSGNKDEQARLFQVGYAAGKAFLKAIEEKTISEDEVNDAPVGVLLILQGPSADFVVGRIFESAMSDAYDSIVKEDSSGVPIFDPSKWAGNELRTIRAENKYHSSNCELLR